MALLKIGRDYSQQSKGMLNDLATLEQSRDSTNRGIKAQEKASKQSNIGIGAGIGWMAGAKAGGSVGGPWGAAIGAGIGFLVSEIF